LFDRLDKGLGSRLILVCAPAGYGKSTLVSQWLDLREECTAWISLDKNDDDWIQFFTYIITAVENSGAEIGPSTTELLNSDRPIAMNELMANLVNDFSRARNDCIVVLDDFHQIQSNNIHSALSFLIENSPPHLKLVILTRTEPDLPLAKFRSQRAMTELQAVDLQFSLAESEMFLNQVMNLGLGADDISILTKRTEGWVVGLQLAALSLDERSDPAFLIKSITGKDRHIADYLIGEVLSRQTEAVQSFLLRTSILERMCGSLCDDVLEINKSQSILEAIERMNLFIIPLDNAREWYRYHHLFAQLLRSRLDREDPALPADLFRRACTWCRQNDYLEEAVRYAFSAKDYNMATDIVALIGHPTYWANRSVVLREWLNELPANFLVDNFDLQILRAYDQINIGKVHLADQTLESLNGNLDRHLTNYDEEEEILRGKLASAFTSIKYHRYMAWEEVHKMAALALELLPSRFSYERCVAYFHGGGALLHSGDLVEAEKYLAHARQLSDSVKNPFAKLITMSNQGTLLMVQGELHKAMDRFREAHEFGIQCRASQEATYSSAVAGIAMIHYEWNRLDKCRQYLDEAIGITEKYDFFDRILMNHHTLIQYHLANLDAEAAENDLSRCRKILVDNGPTNAASRRLASFLAWVRCRKGELSKATAWADDFNAGIGDTIGFEIEPELMIYTRVRIASGAYEDALEHLQNLLALAQNQRRQQSVNRITILLSVVYFKMNAMEKALEHLSASLQLAQQEGYIRSFVDEGEAMQSMLVQLLDQLNRSSSNDRVLRYAHSLLKAFPKSSFNEKGDTMVTAENATVFSMTSRELEVLKLLNQGFTYSEIADRLSISENTLKFHIKNIYGKLQVNKRIKAVAKAKSLGYL
jgi:LuxR family maltose regulon positive regulatory protein